VHPETHFTDEKAGHLRGSTYTRLRRHWQFKNELMLFREIDDQVVYGIHVYGAAGAVHFANAVSLYHPDTVIRSSSHDGSGEQPAIKDPEGRWDVRPHRDRIISVTTPTLRTWHDVLESDDVPVEQSRMVYAVNRAVADVLSKLAAAPRIGDLGLQFSTGWNETIDRGSVRYGKSGKGYFDSEWGRPSSWDDVILQGPNLHIGSAFFKYPNPTMLHNQDWTPVDLEALDPDEIPITSYKPSYALSRPAARNDYDAAYTRWPSGVSDLVSSRESYRVAYRAMAANTGERTLIATIIPPGAAHINGIFSFGSPGLELRTLASVASASASLLADFVVRVAPKSGIFRGTFERVPRIVEPSALDPLRLRTLRVSCLSGGFASLWESCWDGSYRRDGWTSQIPMTRLEDVGPAWTFETPLRRAVDRRQALVEIDALVALALGVTADELCTIYRTQFPVLYGYDRKEYLYDANGRLVPTPVRQAWARAGDNIRADDLVHVHSGSGVAYTYELPFRTLDREADMRTAYAEFERRLGLVAVPTG